MSDDLTPDELLAAWRGAMGGPVLYTLVDGVPTPCDDVLTWATWMEHAPERIVAHDRNEGDGPDGTHVSTVFLGLDMHLASTDGPPLLFETMVFGGVHDNACERYTTLVEAMAGHQRWCKRVNTSEPL